MDKLPCFCWEKSWSDFSNWRLPSEMNTSNNLRDSLKRNIYSQYFLLRRLTSLKDLKIWRFEGLEVVRCLKGQESQRTLVSERVNFRDIFWNENAIFPFFNILIGKLKIPTLKTYLSKKIEKLIIFENITVQKMLKIEIL